MLVLVPEDEIEEGMEILRAAMESVKFSILLSEGKTHHNQLAAEMHPWDKKGGVV